MGSRLYVGNISYQTTEVTLRDLFSQGGKKVDEVAIIMDRETGRSRGFAFVTMATPEDAQKAIQELDGQMVDGRTLRINEARERQPRTGGGGGPPRFDRGGPGGGGGGFGGDRGGGPPPPSGDRDGGRRARRFGADAPPRGSDDDRPRKKRGGGGGGGGGGRRRGGDDFDY
jgi:RNA recognition motif-containing protein